MKGHIAESDTVTKYMRVLSSSIAAQSETHIQRPKYRKSRWYRYHITSSVADVLGYLDQEILEERRNNRQLNLLYTVVNDLVDLPSDQCLTPTDNNTRSTHSMNFNILSKSTAYLNILLAAIAEATDLQSF